MLAVLVRGAALMTLRDMRASRLQIGLASVLTPISMRPLTLNKQNSPKCGRLGDRAMSGITGAQELRGYKRAALRLTKQTPRSAGKPERDSGARERRSGQFPNCIASKS